MRYAHLAFAVVATTALACGGAPENSSSQGQEVSSSDWCHAHLKATDGTEIALDYQGSGSFSRGNAFFGIDPLWFNVRRPGLSAADAVRVVFLDVDDAGNTVVASQTVDLKLAEPGRFTGAAAGFLTARYHHQEVAVVINGTWLKDPVGGSSNFKAQFASAITTCGVTF